MLFNSNIFIFIFLSLTLLGYYLVANRGHSRIAIVWLVAASLLFYGWYNPVYVALIACSILFNYLLGTTLTNRKTDNQRKTAYRSEEHTSELQSRLHLVCRLLL